jgi:hypothetical protein
LTERDSPAVKSETGNDYTVRVNRGIRGWEVLIVRPDGDVAFTRPCTDEAEARTFASTVQQHIYWLSPEKLEDYYRLGNEE